MICPLEKSSVTVRISVTDRCQLRCNYCMPHEGVTLCQHKDILSFEEIVQFIQRLQADFTVEKVRLTGGEPLVRKGITSLVGMLSGLGIPDLALTTNGQYLAGMVEDLSSNGLSRVNISLDSLNAETFSHITRGGDIAGTVEGIDSAIQMGLSPMKLNTVVMAGVNDHEVSDLLSFAMERGCELRFLELMPVGYGARHFEERFVSTVSVLKDLSSQFELSPLSRTAGSSSRRYHVRRADGLEGVVGFISPCSDPFCSDCTRLRVTSDGRLMGCLAQGKGVDIRPLLKSTNRDSISEVVHQAFQCKRSDKSFKQPASMAAIGG